MGEESTSAGLCYVPIGTDDALFRARYALYNCSVLLTAIPVLSWSYLKYDKMCRSL